MLLFFYLFLVNIVSMLLKYLGLEPVVRRYWEILLELMFSLGVGVEVGIGGIGMILLLRLCPVNLGFFNRISEMILMRLCIFIVNFLVFALASVQLKLCLCSLARKDQCRKSVENQINH